MIALHTQRGGHVGFFDGLTPSGPTFVDRACSNFVSAVLESQSQTNFLINATRKSLNDFPDTSRPIEDPSTISRIASFATMPANLVRFSSIPNSRVNSYESIEGARISSTGSSIGF